MERGALPFDDRVDRFQLTDEGAVISVKLERRLAGEAATRFRMEPRFSAAAGAAAWQISNPPVLSAAPLLASLELFQQAGIERLREKSEAATLDASIICCNSSIGIPRAAATRGNDNLTLSSSGGLASRGSFAQPGATC